jgi:hypothetical protein
MPGTGKERGFEKMNNKKRIIGADRDQSGCGAGPLLVYSGVRISVALRERVDFAVQASSSLP